MTIGIEPIKLENTISFPLMDENILPQPTEVHYKQHVYQFIQDSFGRLCPVIDILRVVIRLN